MKGRIGKIRRVIGPDTEAHGHLQGKKLGVISREYGAR